MRAASVVALSVAFACGASLPATASASICGWPERMPDAERCRSELSAAQAVGEGGQSAVEALVARADALRDADDLTAAETALACVAARPGAAGDARVRYMVVRRLGILDYSRSRPVEALGRFECALRLAEGLEDKEEVARQLKNIGSALRRIGDYAGAMRALSRSLAMQREAGDAAVGPVLNNIADVYRDLDQAQDAEGYYRQALEVYRASGDTVKAMHVYDSLSELAMDRRDTRGATA
jgi:two-component system sensor histidine kinase ChiS